MDNNDSVKRTATQAQQIVFDELDRLRKENAEKDEKIEQLHHELDCCKLSNRHLADRSIKSEKDEDFSILVMICSLAALGVVFAYVILGYF